MDLKINENIDNGGTRLNAAITILIYLSVFINSYVFFKEPFEFYFGYLIYIVLLPIFIARYGINRNLLYIFLILLITGLFQILLDNNTPILFFKVYTGFTLSYFFYALVIVEFKYDVQQLFKWYLTGCYIAAMIGLVQFISYQIGFAPGYNLRWLFNKWGIAPGGIFGIRINSVFSEPTYLATVLSAAFFIALHNLTRKETFHLSRFRSIVIIAAYVLSFSGVGQLGIFLTLVFIAVNYGLVRYIFVIIPALIFLFNVLYENVEDFRMRYDGLVGLSKGEEFKLGETHGSSYILYNNFIVTVENFKTNFLFGSGIGSHPVAFEKYSIAKQYEKVGGINSNAADANSMLLRLISETGLFGTLIFLFIVFKCYVVRDEDNESYHWLISNSILIMILLNLLRQGHYFLNGFPFFVMLYIYNYLSFSNALEDDSQELYANAKFKD